LGMFELQREFSTIGQVHSIKLSLGYVWVATKKIWANLCLSIRVIAWACLSCNFQRCTEMSAFHKVIAWACLSCNIAESCCWCCWSWVIAWACLSCNLSRPQALSKVLSYRLGMFELQLSTMYRNVSVS
jgi:hypothetical protein